MNAKLTHYIKKRINNRKTGANEIWLHKLPKDENLFEVIDLFRDDQKYIKDILVIDTPIEFIEKTIETEVNLSYCILKKKVDFSNTKFKKRLSFSGTQFNSEVYFTSAQFDSEVNFSHAEFDKKNHPLDIEHELDNNEFRSDVDFSGIQFKKEANFFCARFHSVVNFSRTQFKSTADFTDVDFYQITDFGEVDFHSISDFQFTQFYSTVNFRKTKFRAITNFKNIVLKKIANFSEVKFECAVQFSNLEIQDKILFSNTLFENEVQFIDCKITSHTVVSFEGTNCKKTLDISRSNFHHCQLRFWNIKIVSNDKLDTYEKYKNDFSRMDIELSVYSKIRETYRIIKNTFYKEDNRIEGLVFYKKEMEIYEQELKFNKEKESTNTQWDEILLFLNKISNNYGTSWRRGIAFTIGLGVLTFLGLLFTLMWKKLTWKIEDSIDWNNTIKNFVEIINLSRWTDVYFFEEELNGVSYLILFIGRIFIGYGYYQTIQAFRKYGKSS